MDEKAERVANLVEKKYGLTFYKPKSISKFIKEYKEQFFEIIDATYSNIYGTIPFTKEMMDSSISNFKLLLRPQDLGIVFNKNKEIVGFVIVFPSISEVVTKYKGKITLKFLRDFFKNKKNPTVIDLGLIGVRQEYMTQGVAAILARESFRMFMKPELKHIETNLMLENNDPILSLTAHLEREQTKRRRCFIKHIK